MSSIYQILVMLVVFTSNLQAIVVGSNTAVSVEPFTSFPAVDIDNEMLGFGWFANGFSLEDATTTCTFNSVFPVSGTIQLNGGLLVLKQDLTLSNSVDWQSLGAVNGQAYTMTMPSGLKALPSDQHVFENISIFLTADLEITNTITFVGTCTLNGQGFSLFLGAGGAIEIASGSYLKLQDVAVKEIGLGNVIHADDTAVLHLDDTIFVFEDELVMSTGSLFIEDHVTFMGTGTFVYASIYTTTIGDEATWEIGSDIHFNIGKITNGGPNPLYFTESTSVLHLNDCSMLVTGYGCDFLRGTIFIERDVTVDDVSTSTLNGIAIGNGVSADDPTIVFAPGSELIINASHMTFNSGSPGIITTGAHKTAVLHRGPGSYIYVAQSLNLPSMTILAPSPLASTVVVADSATIMYNDTRVVFPGAEFDISSAQQSETAYILEGNDEIFFTKGALPLMVVISGTGNSILGNGNLTGEVLFSDSSAQLQTQLDGEYDSEVVLNGATIILTDDMRLGVSSSITGSGSIYLDVYTLRCGLQDAVWTSSISFFGDNGVIDLHGNLSLSSTWTINGTIIVQGNGNVLDLSTGTIEIAPASTLVLRNIRINGLSTGAIVPTAHDSVVSLDTALLVQSGDYSFPDGSLYIEHEVQIAGGYHFLYDSVQTSTIASYANFHVTDNATLFIGQASPTDLQPLYFESASSQLQFDNANWHVTDNGMILSNGRVLFTNPVTLDVDSTSTAKALVFGTNTLGQDCQLLFGANSTWTMNSGDVVYNNYVPNGFVTAGSMSARILRNAGVRLHIYTNFIAQNFISDLAIGAAPLDIALGKSATLYNTQIRAAGSNFLVNNFLQVGSTITLPGNASVTMQYGGKLLFPLIIAGSNNLISGTGICVAPIYLQNSSASLTFNLQGSINSSIALNGGTLIVGGDLNFNHDALITGSGVINVGSQKVSLDAVDTTWTATTKFIGTGGQLSLAGSVSFASTVTVSGTLLIDGNGNTMEFLDTARLVLEDNSTLIYRNLLLKGLKEESVANVGLNSQIVLDNSVIVLAGDLSFDMGSLAFENNVDILGSHTFTYASTDPCIIHSNARVTVSDHVHLVLGQTSTLITEPLQFEDETANLILDNCSLVITSSGLQLSTGTVTCNRNITLDINSTSTANGFVFGNGLPGDTLTLEFNPGSTINFEQGHMVYNMQNPYALISYSPMARFIRGDASVLHGNYDIGLETMTLEFGNGSSTTLEPGKKLILDNTTLKAPGTEFNVTGVQYNTSVISLIGNDELFIAKGSVPLPVMVSGSSNYVLGNGNLGAALQLTDTAAQLIWGLNGGAAANIDLQGGMIVLLQDLYLGRGVVATSSGIFNLQSSRLVLGSQPITWSSDQTIVGAGGEVTLNADVSLLATWTLSGDCTIDGNGKTLYLDSVGMLKVAPGGQLALKNIVINTHAAQNISCLDNTGVIILDNVTWINDGTITFVYGALEFDNNVLFTGGGTFVYESTMTSTIAVQSNLLLDVGYTFSYDPQGSSSKELLQFIDSSSVLKVSRANFVTGLTGIQLTNGTLAIVGQCTFASATVLDHGNVVVDEGITCGNGTSGHDLLVNLSDGAVISMTNGSLICNNIGANAYTFGNELSSISLQNSAVLQVQQNMNIGVGRVEVNPEASIVVASGKTLTGSIIVLK